MFTTKILHSNDYFIKKNTTKQNYTLNTKNADYISSLKNNARYFPSKKRTNYIKNQKNTHYKNVLASVYLHEKTLKEKYHKKNTDLEKRKLLKKKKTTQSKMLSGLQQLHLLSKKKNLSALTLKSIRLKNVNETNLTPLLTFVVNKIKRSYLQRIKYKNSKFSKDYKGPRPRLFSKNQKRNFALIFYLSKFKLKKYRSLRFVFLKRFFKWYFLLNETEVSRLRKTSKKTQAPLKTFMIQFESRLVNVLLRSKLIFNPQLLPALFKLGAVFVSSKVVTSLHYIVKPLDVIFIQTSLIPYSFYRYNLTRFRLGYYKSDFLTFKKLMGVRDKTIMIWHWYFSYKNKKWYKRVKHLRLKTLNWNLSYMYVYRKLACCVFLRKPLFSDFKLFFRKQPRYFFNFFLNSF